MFFLGRLGLILVQSSFSALAYHLLAGHINATLFGLDDTTTVICLLIAFCLVLVPLPKIIAENSFLFSKSPTILMHASTLLSTFSFFTGCFSLYQAYTLSVWCKSRFTWAYENAVLFIERSFSASEKLQWLREIRAETTFPDSFWTSFSDRYTLDFITSFSHATSLVQTHAETYYSPLLRSLEMLQNKVTNLNGAITTCTTLDTQGLILKIGIYCAILAGAIYAGSKLYKYVENLLCANETDLSFGRLVQKGFHLVGDQVLDMAKQASLQFQFNHIQNQVNKAFSNCLFVLSQRNCDISLEFATMKLEIETLKLGYNDLIIAGLKTSAQTALLNATLNEIETFFTERAA